MTPESETPPGISIFTPGDLCIGPFLDPYGCLRPSLNYPIRAFEKPSLPKHSIGLQPCLTLPPPVSSLHEPTPEACV